LSALLADEFARTERLVELWLREDAGIRGSLADAGLFFVRARRARVPASTMNAWILSMPNEDELRILAAAAIDGEGE